MIVSGGCRGVFETSGGFGRAVDVFEFVFFAEVDFVEFAEGGATVGGASGLPEGRVAVGGCG